MLSIFLNVLISS